MKISALPFLFLALGLLGWSGCGEDDDNSVITTINYDGPNFTAPQLPTGTNTFAAYFPPAVTQQYQGEFLERITFYLQEIPAATRVVVYGEGPNDRTPGAELYRKDITQRVRTTEWIEDRLTPGLEITGEGLWLAVEVELDGQPGDFLRSVGCDQGQNYNPNGDLLLLSTSPGDWISFSDLGTERVNWNIRGVLAE